MRKFFKAKLKYQAENDNGILALITSEFLIDAVSYTEAEAKMYERASEIVRGEFVVDSVVKTSIQDVFDNGEDLPFWLGKVQYYVTDADSGNEKLVNYQLVVSSVIANDAITAINSALGNMLVSYEIVSLVKTKVLEVIPHKEEEEA